MNFAKALALNGAQKVYIVGRSAKTLEDAAKCSPHGNIIPVQGDATAKEDLKRIAERIRNEVGYVNFIFANAGAVGPGPRYQAPSERGPMDIKKYQAEALEIAMEEWDACLRLNVTGVWFTIVACLDLLAEGNNRGPYSDQGIKSQVLINSSVSGFMRGYGSGFA